jgi:serine/threonine protein kinase
MAPEVMKGQPCSTDSDIYAFGMLLYELGARETPFSLFEESPAVVFAVAGMVLGF